MSDTLGSGFFRITLGLVLAIQPVVPMSTPAVVFCVVGFSLFIYGLDARYKRRRIGYGVWLNPLEWECGCDEHNRRPSLIGICNVCLTRAPSEATRPCSHRGAP